jgi:hypothetical protein
MNLFQQSGLNEMAQWVLKIIGAVGGAFLGWFLADPLARISFRIAYHKPIPGWTLPWAKLGGATLLGVIAFMLVSLGGGSGGFFFGSGSPGKDKDKGGKDTGIASPEGSKKPEDARVQTEKDKPKPGEKPTPPVVRKRIEIEVLGGTRVQVEDHYYLLRESGKAMLLKEVEEYFKANAPKLMLHVILTDGLTDGSPDDSTGITDALTRLASRYDIPSVVHRPEAKKGP